MYKTIEFVDDTQPTQPELYAYETGKITREELHYSNAKDKYSKWLKSRGDTVEIVNVSTSTKIGYPSNKSAILVTYKEK